MNAADNLVTQYPDRVSQLNAPVFQYLSNFMPFTGSDQDLYMAVLRPASRRANPQDLLPAIDRAKNPNISTAQDYIDLVNSRPLQALSDAEQNALEDLANNLGVNSDSLNRLISLESNWNPLAANKVSGARGLIQFLPSTAEGMGFEVTSGTVTVPSEKGVKADVIFPIVVLACAAGYIYYRSLKRR